MARRNRILSLLVKATLGIASLTSLSGQIQDQEREFFEKKIRPLLSQKCYTCHSSQSGTPMGDFRLDTRESLYRGGSRGEAVVAGDPERSLLIRAVSHQDPQLKMPPTEKLSVDEISALREWIRRGAAYPGSAHPVLTDQRGEESLFWSFRPLRNPGLPVVRNKDWPASPIDYYVLAGLEKEGLQPAPPADKRTWIRRVTFDMTGLPPTPAEVTDFLNDSSLTARSRVVERLLESPHYGERWARHWLDLVRYAETNGHEFDTDKLGAWRYRDYVIRALNQDLPYNQFVKEHIAGDLLPQQRLSEDGTFLESPLGTAIYWFGELINLPTDSVQARADQVDNQIDVMGKCFLGLTIACARCHDHKFDPVSTRDYHAVAGILHSSEMDETVIDTPAQGKRIKEAGERISQINRKIVEAIEPYRTGLATRLKDYLLAVAELISPVRKTGKPSVQQLAQERSLNGELLEAFQDYLRKACREPDHIFYPFADLVDGLASKRFRSVREGVETLLQELGKLRDDGTILREGEMLFKDFRKEGFAGWLVTGQAFGSGPSVKTPPHQVLRGYWRSGLANSLAGGSDRMVGTLTSKKFQVSHDYLHVRMAGTLEEGKSKESPEFTNRFTVIESGYKSLNFYPSGNAELGWRTTDLQSADGRTCSFEIVDRSRQGHIVVDQIVLSDYKDPPRVASPINRYVLAMLQRPDLDSLESMAEAYQQMFLELGQAGPAGDSETESLLRSLRPTGRLEENLWDAPTGVRDRISVLQESRNAVEETIPISVFAMAIRDDQPRDIRIHIAGSHKNLGEVVPRGVPNLPLSKLVSPVGPGSGRLQLARWLADADNPLPARVMANRIWKHHFGEGIVGSPDNLGRMGKHPTHLELLDFLASRFMAEGWSVKSLHRMILLSETYAMSGKVDPKAVQIDPDNRLLHHFPLRRAEAEVIRDAILAVSGTLNRKLYGPSVPPHISAYQTGRGRPKSGPLDGDSRRTIYVQVRRNFLTPLLLAFDYPPPISSIGRRNVSNVSSQALILLNNEFVAQQARHWARRLIARQQDPHDRLKRMYLEAYARPPRADEVNEALGFVGSQTRLYQEHPKWVEDSNSVQIQVWAELGQVLFNSTEFIYFR